MRSRRLESWTREWMVRVETWVW